MANNHLSLVLFPESVGDDIPEEVFSGVLLFGFISPVLLSSSLVAVFFSVSALAPFSPCPLASAIILSAHALRSWVLSFFSTDDVVMLLELDADSC